MSAPDVTDKEFQELTDEEFLELEEKTGESGRRKAKAFWPSAWRMLKLMGPHKL